jgi:hypothetical protein
VCALRVETVDDVHLAVRFASLLQIHIQDLRRSTRSGIVRNSQQLPGYSAGAASSTLQSNHSHNHNTSNTVAPDVIDGVSDNVNKSSMSDNVGAGLVEDSLGYSSGLEPSMHFGQFEDNLGSELNNPFLFNVDETWNVFGNMLW